MNVMIVKLTFKLTIVTDIFTYDCHCLSTLPTAKILSGKNARAYLVCRLLMKSFKKIYPENMKTIVGTVWKLPPK